MGDIIDELLDIRNEFSEVKEDFTSASDELLNQGKTLRDIWDPARFECKPQIDQPLCLHTKAADAECSLCQDICPASALTVGAQGLSLEGKSCVGCGLCTAVCPTGALVSAAIEPKVIYGKVLRNAIERDESYVTCARALDHTPPEGVVVVPCLGVMRAELWFSLLAGWANIGIFLPVNACGNCSCKAGEELYSEAVATAERWARETVDYEWDEAKLNVDKSHGAQRSDLMRGVLASAAGTAGLAHPVARQASAALQALSKSAQQLAFLQTFLDKTSGEDSNNQRPRMVLDSNRQLMVMALQAYPDLAPHIKLPLSKTTEECSACGACVAACPTGARRLENSVAQVVSTYCVGCGLCVDLCPTGAAVLKKRFAKVLLQEVSAAEKMALR